jgi:hypothetical protein
MTKERLLAFIDLYFDGKPSSFYKEFEIDRQTYSWWIKNDKFPKYLDNLVDLYSENQYLKNQIKVNRW